METDPTYTAFAGARLLASGDLPTVLRRVKARIDREDDEVVLVFEDHTGKQVDFDLTGTADEVVERAVPTPAPAGRGRPKLGVVSREVSLLPRHWEWLEAQPNGISAALRRLVDEARKNQSAEQRARLAREAAHRFMTAMAGNEPGYEEALRALYAKDRARFEQKLRKWPAAFRAYAERLAAPSFEEAGASEEK